MLLKKSRLIPNKTIEISGSKSESNRLLILQKLFGGIEIENCSDAQDTRLMREALESDQEVIDIHHAGTVMRFLTSYFAIQEGKTTILTGSERMKQRPICHLVKALRDLGADIEYLGNEGFPPLKIRGKKLFENVVEIPANLSSQFISSLVLIGTKSENGLTIRLIGNITSRPYLEMTIKLINSLYPKGEKISFDDNRIIIPAVANHHRPTINFTVESDWSSASYFYSMAAIGKQNIHLKHLKKTSLQGDAILADIYKSFFGVESVFGTGERITLSPAAGFNYPSIIKIDMNNCPDIAPTVCVTAAALNIPFKITGLGTLKVKETDRLTALCNELKKIGVTTIITTDSIESVSFFQPEKEISIRTYDDHRMAMSFAPFCLIQDIEIQHPEVVIKSYPQFWKDLTNITTNIE